FHIIGRAGKFRDNKMDIELDDEGKSLHDYLQIFRRRKYLIIIVLYPLVIFSLIVALILPPVFRSAATIMIEQQQIPTDLVKSTVMSLADERLKQIEQQLMTVNHIKEIIDEFKLYPKEKKRSDSDLADLFHKHFAIELIDNSFVTNNRNTKATIAFKIAFEHESPEIAAHVADKLTTLFLEENVKNRTRRAEETANFLQEEAEKMKQDVSNIETEIAQYKKAHSESLPELLPVYTAAISRLETEMQQATLQEKMLNERRAKLKIELAITSPYQDKVANDNKAEPVETLAQLKEQYNQLLDKYSASHPDVKILKRKIDNFKSEDEPEDSTQEMRNITNPIYMQLKNEWDMIAIELDNLVKQRIYNEEQHKKLQALVANMPELERRYDELRRDLENNKAKYQELKSKFLEARLSQTLEIEQKAERFSIIEPARISLKPEKPNRLQILIAGIFASIGCSFGLALLIETINGSIRNYRNLMQVTGIEPLVVVPYIHNQQDIINAQKNRNKIIIITILFLLTIVIIVLINKMYSPLHIIITNLLVKLS
ncbi:MAG: hypothetical protein RL637_1651, partial [Pseudomonadota bacterium]